MGLMIISSNTNIHDGVKEFSQKWLSESIGRIVYLSLADYINKDNFSRSQSFFKTLGFSVNASMTIEDIDSAKSQKDLDKASCLYVSYVDIKDLMKKFDHVKSILDCFIHQNNKLVIFEGDACSLIGKNVDISNGVVFEDCSDKLKNNFELVDFNVISNWNEYKERLCVLLDISRGKEDKFYAVSDGNGIIKMNNDLLFYGDILELVGGRLRMFKGL